ncbi:MAG TPA: hypothetical protein VIK08_02670 [Candidatus Limnocylindrales bacterium]
MTDGDGDAYWNGKDEPGMIGAEDGDAWDGVATEVGVAPGEGV